MRSIDQMAKRRLRLWWLRRRLIALSAQHRRGYLWAVSELRNGGDPEAYIWHDEEPSYRAFDCGVYDAMRDYGGER
jgi:hypothetical protein